MKDHYFNIYNNLIKLTRNKYIFKNILNKETFSDRITIFFFHFAFFLKTYKSEKNQKILQEIYDFNFKQLELSIREIGYGDQSINKKMKVYLNLFHAIVSEIHFWDDLDKTEKLKKLSIFLEDFNKIENLVEYFEDFNQNLSKKSLNFFLKGVSNP